MKRAFVLLAAILVLAGILAAQNQTQAPTPNHKEMYKGLKYDVAAEKKIAGVVEDLEDFDCPISAAMGNHLVLKTETGTVIVHIAPLKFIKEYGLELSKGDQITVTGAMLKDSEGRDTMIAREVVRDVMTFTFRTKDGKPVW